MSDTTSAWLIFGIVASVPALIIFSKLGAEPQGPDQAPFLGGFPVSNAWKFFSQRNDFLRAGFEATGRKLFKFRILQRTVVVASGTQARKTFLNEPGLDFFKGYATLKGSLPTSIGEKTTPEEDAKRKEHVARWMHAFFRPERLESILPSLVNDLDRQMGSWENEGQFNPFETIYELMFQITARIITCDELADDKAALSRIAKIYIELEESATPVSCLLPTLPSPALWAKVSSMKRLYDTLNHYVEIRRKAEAPSNAAIDMLIREGLSNYNLIRFIMLLIFAGVINAGVIATWILIFIDTNPPWKDKLREELRSLVAKFETDPTQPLAERIKSVPFKEWESSTPMLDLVIRETLRFAMYRVIPRLNTGDPFILDGTRVNTGEFVVYPLSDVHRNPEIYPEPHKFDPERYLPGREEDKKVPMGFLGWGAGRHPCVGMRVAKMEMKIVVAMFLLGYEYEIVDSAGIRLTEAPQIDLNDTQQSRPLGGPFYMKYRKQKISS